jgi:hypothetical protein
MIIPDQAVTAAYPPLPNYPRSPSRGLPSSKAVIRESAPTIRPTDTTPVLIIIIIIIIIGPLTGGHGVVRLILLDLVEFLGRELLRLAVGARTRRHHRCQASATTTTTTIIIIIIIRTYDSRMTHHPSLFLLSSSLCL